MTNEEIAAQVTALWHRVGKTEMAQPSALGYTLDEEVFLLCQSLVSQAYEEAARAVCIYCAANKALSCDRGTPYHPQGSIWLEQDGSGTPRDAPCHAAAIRALKDSLAQEPVAPA